MPIQRITIVMAKWCPHCYPLALEAARRMGIELGVPVRVLDIDVGEEEKAADEIVAKYGDWSKDYIIPQIFLEHADGRVRHIFTGYSEGVHVTGAKLENIFRSDWYKELLGKQR